MKTVIDLSKERIDHLLDELEKCNFIKKKETAGERLDQVINVAITNWFIQRDYWRKVDEDLENERIKYDN